MTLHVRNRHWTTAPNPRSDWLDVAMRDASGTIKTHHLWGGNGLKETLDTLENDRDINTRHSIGRVPLWNIELFFRNNFKHVPFAPLPDAKHKALLLICLCWSQRMADRSLRALRHS